MESLESVQDGRDFAAACTKVVQALSQREAQHSERLGNIDTQASGQLVQIVDPNRICQTVANIRARGLPLLYLLLLDLVILLRWLGHLFV